MNPSITHTNTTGRPFWQTACLSTVICGGLALMAGCAGPESHVVSAPPPPAPQTQVVVTQPQAVQALPVQGVPGTVIVTQAPPTLQQEYVSAQPTSDHRWVPGYWTWSSDNSRYEWVSGHWKLPPSRSSVWVAPRWERTSTGAYRFYQGYWN